MQTRAKPSFEWPEPPAELKRDLAPVKTAQILPKVPEPRPAAKGKRLFAVATLGALAYLALTSDLRTIIIISAILGVLLALLVRWAMWVMDSVLY